MISNEEDNDFGEFLSNKSIEYFENGKYLEAVDIQLEVVEDCIKMLIHGRGKHLGLSNTKIHKLADEGDLETRINNLIELCDKDFSHLCTELHEWRNRRNRLRHRKSTYKSLEDLNEFARLTWLMGTTIIYNFMENISNIPIT